MAELTVGCAEVNVIRIGVPRFTVTPPTSTVEIQNPDTSLVVKNPSLTVTVEEPESSTHIILPIPGPPGPAGAGGQQELYVSMTAPVGATEPYLWIETDVDGDAVAVHYGATP
jgi:hypothetical protein